MATKKTAKKTPTKKAAPKKKAAPRKRKPPAAKLTHIADQLRPLAEALDGLTLNPKNAVKHDQASIDAIAGSLKAYGQVKPIVANTDGIILAGNGTYQAAQSLGWTQIAVVRVKQDAASQTGFAIADNRSAEFAHWDDELLAELLSEMHGHNPDLFAALELSELCDVAGDALLSDSEHVEFDAESKDVPETWIVAVEVDNEEEQKKLYDRLVKEGYKVKVQML